MKTLRSDIEDQTIQVDNSIYLSEEGGLSILKGRLTIADDSDAELARLCRIALKIASLQQKASIAIIGCGLAVLPRLLNGANVTVYELYREVVDEMNSRFRLQLNAIIGDYMSTLKATYDVVVWDAFPSTLDVPTVKKSVNPGGVALDQNGGEL